MKEQRENIVLEREQDLVVFSHMTTVHMLINTCALAGFSFAMLRMYKVSKYFYFYKCIGQHNDIHFQVHLTIKQMKVHKTICK